MSATFSLEGKNAVVTGLSTGIGQAIADALAREGANVAGDFMRDADGAEVEFDYLIQGVRRGYTDFQVERPVCDLEEE